MLLAKFLTLTLFIFLAIVGGIIGIVLEGQRIPAGSGAHNPATHDTVFPIVGWATLFLLYLVLEIVDAQDLTTELKIKLGALAMLPFFYAALATAWLIWRSAWRIYASLRGRLPVVWHALPFLSSLRFPILFVAVIWSLVTAFLVAGFSLGFFLLASVFIFLSLIRKPVTP